MPSLGETWLELSGRLALRGQHRLTQLLARSPGFPDSASREEAARLVISLPSLNDPEPYIGLLGVPTSCFHRSSN
jgi:hypothetical protein